MSNNRMKAIVIGKTITPRDKILLDRYLQEIGREILITVEQEVALAQKIKEGDKNALEKIIKANLRFVVSVAKQYQNQGLSLPDLINEGNLGLVKAAERFDETRGFKFISYAVWRIRQSILQALAQYSRIVRLPLNQVGNLNKIRRVEDRLEQDLEREPTAEEIAKELDTINIEKIIELNEAKKSTASLDAPIGDAEQGSLLDMIENGEAKTDNKLIDESLKKEISRSLDRLNDREARVVKMYFGINMEREYALEEIGDEINITRERVRQIKERALQKLRHKGRSKNLRNYLG